MFVYTLLFFNRHTTLYLLLHIYFSYDILVLHTFVSVLQKPDTRNALL